MLVEVSEAANADLDEVYDYGAGTFGLAAADAYLRQFQAAYALIAEHPYAGPEHAVIRPPIRSIPCGSHRVYYDVLSDRIVVRRVLHKRADVERHL